MSQVDETTVARPCSACQGLIGSNALARRGIWACLAVRCGGRPRSYGLTVRADRSRRRWCRGMRPGAGHTTESIGLFYRLCHPES